MAARKVKVIIAEGCVVYIDGVARSAGEVAEVSAADAKSLVDQGVAEKA